MVKKISFSSASNTKSSSILEKVYQLKLRVLVLALERAVFVGVVKRCQLVLYRGLILCLRRLNCEFFEF
jgi:hypothetical protein